MQKANICLYLPYSLTVFLCMCVFPSKHLYIWTECLGLSLPKTHYVKTLTPNVMVFGDGVLGNNENWIESGGGWVLIMGLRSLF